MTIHRPARAEVDDMRRAPAAMAVLAAWVLVSGSTSRGAPPATEAARTRTDPYGDPLPPGARARMGTLRYYAGLGTSAVAFAPDGKTLATGSEDTTTLIWDVTPGDRGDP